VRSGFTLVELMVTVAVLAVVSAIAAPNFKRLILSNRLSTVANDVVLAVNTARMEAIKRNATVLVCSDGSVYASSCDSSGTKVRAPVSGADSTVKITGGVVGLSFSPQGIANKTGVTGPYGDTVADVCTTGMTTDNHRLIKMVGGSILATTTTSGGTCQ
jgi:type IV fimbrial biogenesis protein FimT